MLQCIFIWMKDRRKFMIDRCNNVVMIWPLCISALGLCSVIHWNLKFSLHSMRKTRSEGRKSLGGILLCSEATFTDFGALFKSVKCSHFYDLSCLDCGLHVLSYLHFTTLSMCWFNQLFLVNAKNCERACGWSCGPRNEHKTCWLLTNVWHVDTCLHVKVLHVKGLRVSDKFHGRIYTLEIESISNNVMPRFYVWFERW